MKKLVFVLLAALSTVGFAKNSEKPQVEVILEATSAEEGVKFRVFSGGCTFKDDFELVVDDSVRPVRIQLQRLRQDLCLAYLPNGVSIEYSWDELGLDQQRLWIMNPLQVGQ